MTYEEALWAVATAPEFRDGDNEYISKLHTFIVQAHEEIRVLSKWGGGKYAVAIPWADALDIVNKKDDMPFAPTRATLELVPYEDGYGIEATVEYEEGGNWVVLVDDSSIREAVTHHIRIHHPSLLQLLEIDLKLTHDALKRR